MDFASDRAYISKRKLQQAVPGKNKLNEIQEKENSDCSISDEELDEFEAEVKGGGSPAEANLEEIKSSRNLCAAPEKSSSGFFGFFSSIGSIFSSKKSKEAPPMQAASKPSTMARRKHSAPEKKSSSKSKKRHRQEVDTNVIAFNLSVLKDKTEIATGDAVVCGKCKAMFNVHSQLAKDPLTNEQMWTCEFCNNPNKVSIEEEEMPKSDSLTYVIESAQQSMMKKGGGDDITLMFCIDISGSMCVTQPVQGKLDLKYNKVKKLQDLLKFSDGSMQYVSGESAGLTYVSRMQCVQTAIESQLKELALGAPKRKVGIVTFNSEVTLIGDGKLAPKTFAGDKLHDYEGLIETAQKDAEVYMSKTVEETKDDLIRRLEQIEESGQTALGPALTLALGMAAKGAPGSRVILCTDGLANVGMGSVENLKDPKDIEAVKGFYTKLGEVAKERGVSISIISIVSAECNLDMISPLADLTGGDIMKVDPLNLSSDFAAILSENVIATNVELRVKLHKGLTFRNEDSVHVTQDGSLLTRPIGNATDGQEVTVEYRIKPTEELSKMADVDFTKLERIPFQTQISYMNLEGMKCVRLVTKNQKITFEKEEAKKAADYKVISVNAVQQTAKLARKGQLRDAQANAVHWRNMMKGSDAHDDYVKSTKPLYSALQCQEQMNVLDLNAQCLDSVASNLNKATKANRKRWFK